MRKSYYTNGYTNDHDPTYYRDSYAGYGGFLYPRGDSMSVELLFMLMRCVVINGIDLGALRGDWRHAHRECRALAYP